MWFSSSKENNFAVAIIAAGAIATGKAKMALAYEGIPVPPIADVLILALYDDPIRRMRNRRG